MMETAIYQSVLKWQEGPRGLTKPLWVVVTLLLAVSIFDPADLLLHAKVPLFVLTWGITLLDLVLRTDDSWPIPYGLFLYVTFFCLVLPLSSIFLYFLQGGMLSNYDGFLDFKAYLFLSIAFPLAIKRISLVRTLSWLLTVMSVFIIIIYVITSQSEALRLSLMVFGGNYGIFAFGERTYGSFTYHPIYFQASPLIVIALGYFACRCVRLSGRARLWSSVVLMLNMLGMFWSGTRNNMLASLLVPVSVIFWYSRRKPRLVLWAVIAAIAIVIWKGDVILEMLNPREYDNALKLVHARDYMAMFQQWRTLLLGQGLGARFHSTLYGYVSVTELTYFDLIRNYGIAGAAVALGLLLYPLRAVFIKEQRPFHYLYITYGIYLILCLSNPLLFSSSGMLLLALVVCNYFSVAQGAFSPGMVLEQRV